MSGWRVVLAPAAESDVGDALRWYRDRNALAADALRTEVLEAIDAVADAPMKHRADAEGVRRRVLRRFPYSVIYEVVDRTVTILAVAHHRRRPGYWRAGGR